MDGESVELESAGEEADADALTQTESLQEPQGETEPASPEDENPTEPEEKRAGSNWTGRAFGNSRAG